MQSDAAIVKFEGPWTDREQRIVTKAVVRAEEALDRELPKTLIGKPWLCQKGIDEGQRMYLARRVNVAYDFTGATLTYLVKDLLYMAGEQRRRELLVAYWTPETFRTPPDAGDPQPDR